MAPREPRLLALDPGTRRMGVAVFEGRELIYHTVEVLPRGGTPGERLLRAVKATQRMIEDFGPDFLALEAAFAFDDGNAVLLRDFIQEVRDYAARRGIHAIALAPSTVKKRVAGHGHSSKRRVAHVVLAEFPELGAYLPTGPEWKARFHLNMFDAVAVGLAAMQELDCPGPEGP